MRISIERNILLKALAHAMAVTEKRGTIPILSNLLLDAKGASLRITATDMELAIVESVAAEILREGKTTVPAATLFEIVRRVQDGVRIELEHKGGNGQLTLTAGRYQTNLVTLDPSDFPEMTAGGFTARFAIACSDLRAMIDRTRFAISNEETRYYLNGIYLHEGDTDGERTIRAVATDGHRLALAEIDAPAGLNGTRLPGIIVPRKMVAEMRKILDDGLTEIDLSISDTRIRIEAGPIAITSKLIDGTFPDYMRVIPAPCPTTLRINKSTLVGAIARVAAISTERTRPVTFELGDGGLAVSASDSEHGQAREEIDPSEAGYDGLALRIGFQARYLDDIAAQMTSTMIFHVNDAAGPVLVRDEGNDRYRTVIMPMRT
jgi:DNA polymerase-3 subunit beta